MTGSVSVPGRVNLIGEHIDYHNLPVLPMAIEQRVTIEFQQEPDGLIRAVSRGYEAREFALSDAMPFPAGDWGNYLKASAVMLNRRWALRHGLCAVVHSDLPEAAGLSSSSALLTAFALALLRANDMQPSLHELLELLPEGEQFVGTRGGGMDHAAVLASRRDCALLIRFQPLALEAIPIPHGWTFLIAHSLTRAEKSGAVKAAYNARRSAGLDALRSLGLSDYREVLERPSPESYAAQLEAPERDSFLHVISEAQRVEASAHLLRVNNIEEFGRLLCASHASLRDRLRVSNEALDELVECAVASGALGARLTGAGFGGCVLILCRDSERERVRSGLIERFYRERPQFRPELHLLIAHASDGALYAN